MGEGSPWKHSDRTEDGTHFCMEDARVHRKNQNKGYRERTKKHSVPLAVSNKEKENPCFLQSELKTAGLILMQR